MGDMDLSILIVNWNTQDLLAQCLESLAEIQKPGERSSDLRGLNSEVIVVDNASTDDSVAMVKVRFPWVHLIESQKNLGFAGGNNLALPWATGQNLLLLNPDTVVMTGAVELLLQVLETNPNAAIVGAQLLNADGTSQVSGGEFPSLWTELPLINRRPIRVRKMLARGAHGAQVMVQSVDWVSGACLMIKRTISDTIGLLDESFWLYSEETDLCYRARQAGWDVLLVPAAKVHHLARGASRQRIVFAQLHFYQSRVRFAFKYYGRTQASAMKRVMRLKAAIWRRWPGFSPLRGAYPGLADTQICAAYRTLEVALALPLVEYLASDWQE